HVGTGAVVMAVLAARLLAGVVHVHRGQVDLVPTGLEAGAEQRVRGGVVLGGDEVVVAAHGQRVVLDAAVLLDAGLGLPLVAEAADRDQAEAGAVAEVEGAAAADVEAEVRIDAVGRLQQVQRRVDEAAADDLELVLGEVALVDAQAGIHGLPQRAGNLAGAVVVTGPVVLGTV